MIYVECDADMELLNYFAVPRANKKHAGNKSEVIKKVLKDRTSLGIVDEDPGKSQPSNLGKFRSVSREENLLLRQHENAAFLISIVPFFEEWLIRRAKEQGIDLEALGLPDSGDRLHERLLEDMKKLRPLLEALDEKSDKEFAMIRHLIQERSK